jgi:D-aspartate ligase
MYWRSWKKRNAARTVDAAADETDPIPGYIHALSELYLGLKILLRRLHTMPDAAALFLSRALERRCRE